MPHRLLHRVHTPWTLTAALACGLVSAPSLADEVHLKGGGRLSGVIVERTPTTLVLETAPGRIGVPLARVERIVTAHSPLAEYNARAARVAASDGPAWLALAHWAQAQGLATAARQAAERVLALDPHNEEAQRVLGNVRFDDRWMSPDDARRAQGLVLFEGEWVSAAEREERLRVQEAQALADKARAEAEARVREAEARARAAEADARRSETEAEHAADDTGSVPVWFGGSGATLHPPSRLPHERAERDCGGPTAGTHGRNDPAPPPRASPQPKGQALVGSRGTRRRAQGSDGRQDDPR